MTHRSTAAAIAVASVVAMSGYVTAGGGGQSARPAAITTSPSTSDASARVVLNQYCVTCHNDRNKANAGGLALDEVDTGHVGAAPEVWERVVRKLRAGLMPPVGRPRPDAATYEGLLRWAQGSLDHAAAEHPNPGRKDTFHRLNRTEYHNVVRDLLDLEIDVADLLPVDNPSYGFDNIAGTLTLNESLMEQYLAAAQTIATAALGADATPAFREFRAPYEFSQEERLEGFPMGTRGGLRARPVLPQDGEYTIEVKLMCGSIVNGENGCGGAFPDAHDLEVTIDGERVALIALPAKGAGKGPMKEAYTLRTVVKAGPRDVAAWFLRQPPVDEFDGVRVKFDKPMHRSNAVDSDWKAVFQPSVASITVGGPYAPAGPGDTPSRRRLLVCQPARPADERPCARRVASTLARRAFRRPVTDAQVDALMSFYDAGKPKGFERGIDLVVRRILTSPDFLFRIEQDPAGAAPDSNYKVSDLELASRLSFFLWRTSPDDELLDLAVRGRLSTPAVFAQQVHRLLASDRAEEMTADFAGQWLQLRKVDVAFPNAQMFPNFDARLKRDLRRETELFVDSIRRDDRGVPELLTADYSFLNERVATHYGIGGVKGSHFRRVVYGEDNPRRGLLGQASILTVTSAPIRTRPVVRGKWILENLLGTPPPAPPPNVPPLKESGAVLAQSMRERMAAHRANAVCASCHSMIDPLGFALENFGPVGQYRKVDENFAAIDASGRLPDGTAFDSLAAFRAALVRKPEVFVTTVTEKLLIYALGRGLEPYDMPAVRAIVRGAAPSGYRFSSLVLGVVSSAPFTMRRAASMPAPTSTAAVRP
jgi:hypothetical protein